MYDSWKSIMELYMMNRQQERMILESVENVPLIRPTIEENGVTRPIKYSELSPTDAIQADCDVKATNIILQDVKLVKDLHITNIDQLHAYLGQNEFHTNEVRLMHERNSDPLALVVTHQMTQSPYQTHQNSYQNSHFHLQVSLYQSPQYGSPYQSQEYSTNQPSTPLSITYPSNDYQSSVHHNVYSPQPSIPQLEYAPTVNQQPQQPEFPQLDSGLTVPVFKQGFQNPFYLKKAQQFEPKLYDGNVIKRTSAIKRKFNTTPVDYAVLNPTSKILKKIVPQIELSAKQAFWSQNSMNSSDPSPTYRPTKFEVPKELPKVSMVNTSLKKLKHHLAGFDVVVKERTTATTITEGSWVWINNASVNVHECENCLKLETELLNKKDFIEKETYNKLFKSFTTLEKHFISLELDTQLNQEIFQRENSVSNQSAPSFNQYFELNELKAQSQEKDTIIKKLKERTKSLSENINKDKVKKDIEEIETINIELDHRVSKLIAENEHLKQTYKQLYDSIKPTRIRSKEQCDALVSQVNQKKLKGKDIADNVVTKHTIAPEMLKIDVEYLNPKLLHNRSAHFDYLKHTQEEATILREIMEQGKLQNPLNNSLYSTCKYTKQIQEFLIIIRQTCPSINNFGDKLVAVTPKNKDKRVRFVEPVTSSGNTYPKTDSSLNLVSNKPALSSTRVIPSTSASGSQPSGNTKKDKIQRTPSSP
ncbi:hypothetical protein Tco_0260123 [Tanacetum coccineum]